MSNKVDLFKADKAMSERVAAFMRVNVWNITLKARLEKAMKEADQRIETLEGLKADTGKDYSAMIADIEEVRTNARKDYEKAVEESEKFEYTAQDKALYKAYENCDTVEGLIKWFSEYGLEVDKDTNLVQELTVAFMGSKALSGRGVVRANAEKFTKDIRSKSDILKVFYGKLAEAMMSAGTLKPEAIPEDVREIYAPKKANKK